MVFNTISTRFSITFFSLCCFTTDTTILLLIFYHYFAAAITDELKAALASKESSEAASPSPHSTTRKRRSSMRLNWMREEGMEEGFHPRQVAAQESDVLVLPALHGGLGEGPAEGETAGTAATEILSVAPSGVQARESGLFRHQQGSSGVGQAYKQNH